jgi:hypothetical protein
MASKPKEVRTSSFGFLKDLNALNAVETRKRIAVLSLPPLLVSQQSHHAGEAPLRHLQLHGAQATTVLYALQ